MTRQELQDMWHLFRNPPDYRNSCAGNLRRINDAIAASYASNQPYSGDDCAAPVNPWSDDDDSDFAWRVNAPC